MAAAKKKTTMPKPKTMPKKAVTSASSAAKPAFGTPAWRAKYMKGGK